MKLIVTLGAIAAIFVSIIILDYIWLGIITKRFIISQFGSLVKVKDGSVQIQLLAGLLAWFVIALGCYIFVVAPSGTAGKAAMMGAMFGFIAYAIYDLTNLTFIVKYPLTFAIVDIGWGTFLCATISTIGFFTRNAIMHLVK